MVGVASMTLFFKSTKYLPIGTTVSLRYMAPIFAAVFAVAFSGVLILKEFDTELNGYGLVLITISAIFSGLVYVVISKVGMMIIQ